jgi:DNA polymerase ligase (LigD)-like protein
MARFAILEHDWPSRHWDFFLEAGSVARAWRLLEEPRLATAVPAEPNGDHRLLYLDYEGPVSGGRGSVTRWDVGMFDWIADEPARVVIELHGQRLTCRVVIEGDSARFG